MGTLDSIPLEELTDLTQDLALSEESRESLYSIAYHCYYNGKYEEALNGFTLLALTESGDLRYWMGVGACQQVLQKLEEALGAYAFAALINAEDPLPPFHAAQCLFTLGRKEDGFLALALAEKLAKRNPETQELLSRISVMQETWSSQKPCENT